jgi:hypothetical protein
MKKLLMIFAIMVMASLCVNAVVFDPDPTDQVVNENVQLTIDLTASGDLTGDSVFETNGTGTLTRNSDSSATYTWTPSYDDAGTRDIWFKVSNDGAEEENVTITITVNNVNREPQITTYPVGNQLNAVIDQVWSFDIDATDQDADDTITFSLDTGAPSGMTIDSDTGEISYVPSSTGSYPVTVIASDGEDEDTRSFTIQAIDNRPPAFTDIPTEDEELRARVDNEYTFNLQASDPDGNTLSYALVTAPDDMTINPSTGFLSWTPAEEDEGEENIVVSVNDGTVTVQASFTLTVLPSSMLRITDLSVDCSPENCEDENFDEDNIQEITEVVPGTTMTIEIEVTNMWDEDDFDNEIDRIEICGTLEDIGDEDEQEECEDANDLDPEEDDTVTLTFDIPLEAEEDTYDLEIDIEGRDEDGTRYNINYVVDVDVEKQDHDVEITRAVISPSTISCTRFFTLDVEVKNFGGRDEDVELSIIDRSGDLEIDDTEFFEIESGDYDDDDTEWNRRFSYRIDDDVDEGTYPITVRAYYDDRDESVIEEVQLNVQDCVEDTPTPTPTPTATPTPTPTKTPDGQVVVPTPEPTPTIEDTDDDDEDETSVWFVAFLALLLIILIIVAIWMFSIIMKK